MGNADFLSVLDDHIDLGAIGDMDTIAKQVAALSAQKLNEFTSRLWAALPAPTKSDAPFRFVANSMLSGLPYPCGGFSCRSESLAEIATFSAFYASEVVLFNPFRRLMQAPPRSAGSVVRRKHVEEISFAVSEILLLRPLIERGICTFVDEANHSYCRDCFQKAISHLISGSVDESDDGDIYFLLMARFADAVRIRVDNVGKREICLALEGPEDIVPHQRSYHYTPRARHPELIDLGKRDLTREEILKYGAGNSFAHYTSSDVVKASSISTEYGVGNIIASTQHMAVMRGLFGDAKFGNPISVDYPVISGGKLEDVVSFRETEWHHLNDFRNAVEGGLKSGQDVGAELRNSSANINRILSKSRRQFARDITKEAAIAAVGITATVATAGVSGLLALAVGAVSGGHLAKGVVPKLIDRLSEPEEIVAEKSYYAWKVAKKLSH